MKGLVITSKGIEDVAAIEIKELINANCEIENACAIFDFENFRELCLLCYKCQSADKIIYLAGNFEFKNFFDDLGKFIAELDLDEWIGDNSKNFKVECIRLGSHDFRSIDAEAKAAELIQKKFRLKGVGAGIGNYEILFLIYVVDNKCYLGIDFCGFSLNKRSYKIFLHPNSLRGTIAYALLRESGFEKEEVMLDPFSRDGVIPIEAAFYATNFPLNYYKKQSFAFLKLKLNMDFERFFADIDKMIKKVGANIYSYDYMFKYIDYSRKNAKIAGVGKQLNFSRADIGWLDIKFKEGSVDRIVTNLPSSRNPNLDKIYNEFFYQSAYILKNSGTLALISRLHDSAKKHAENHSFVISKEKDVWSGEQLLKIMVFKKKSI